MSAEALPVGDPHVGMKKNERKWKRTKKNENEKENLFSHFCPDSQLFGTIKF